MRRKTVIGLFVIGLCLLTLTACTKDVVEKPKEPEVGVEYHPEDTQGGPMVNVPSGEFWMGCNAKVEDKSNCLDSENPYHKVYLDAYYINKYEVTVEDYAKCFEAGKCETPTVFTSKACNWGVQGRGQHPINCVSWLDAKAYCAWAGKRLPTEAEWEKAARGTDGHRFPWGNEMASCEYAIMDDSGLDEGGDGCGKNSTWPVGSKPKGVSPYGAMDMSGNVDELVADWLGENYYSTSPAKNPKGPSSGKKPVLRGGSWPTHWEYMRASIRWNAYTPDFKDDTYGFRCAKTP